MRRRLQHGNKRAKGCLVVLGVVLLALTAVPLAAAASAGLNVFTGEYRYDPRTAAPAPWILANRPEQSVLDYIHTRTTSAGVFPAVSSAQITSVEATAVRANVYTDWQTPADVEVRFRFSNGSTSTRYFDVHSSSSGGWELGNFAVSLGARFSQITDCFPNSPLQFACVPP